MTDRTSFTCRMDPEVLEKIDARAKEVGLSRNEWVERCCRWSLVNLPYGQEENPGAKIRFAQSAPSEVSGGRTQA